MKRFGLITFIFLCSFSLSKAQSDWKLSKQGNGVKVYTRTAEGSNIKEFKATISIKAKAVDIAQEVINVADYKDWYPDVMGSKVLEKPSKYEWIVYYRVDVPWPGTDRDAVSLLKVEMDEEKKNIKILSSAKLNYKEEFYGVVRLKKTDGSWTFTEKNGVTEVKYQMLADPGGNLPAWIVNMFLVDGPYKTLLALQKRVE